MPIQSGDRLPDVTLRCMIGGAVREISTFAYCRDAVVVLFAVPGAFTPACSARHLPGFLERSGELRQRGVDKIACVAVNDIFVMSAWAPADRLKGRIDMLADGNAEFTRAVGLTHDASAYGMGLRSQRYALVAKYGTVSQILIDQPGAFEVSAAEHVLARL